MTNITFELKFNIITLESIDTAVVQAYPIARAVDATQIGGSSSWKGYSLDARSRLQQQHPGTGCDTEKMKLEITTNASIERCVSDFLKVTKRKWLYEKSTKRKRLQKGHRRGRHLGDIGARAVCGVHAWSS